MTATQPLHVAFPTPGWFNEFIFTVRDAAAVTAAKVSTINHWAEIAAAHGHFLKRRYDSRAFLSGHAVYVIAILAALAKAGVSIGVGVIGVVLDGTKSGVPGLGDRLVLHDGPAAIEVDLSTVWIEIGPRLAPLALERP